MNTYLTDKINTNKKFFTILLVFSFVFFGVSLGYVLKKSSSQAIVSNVAGVFEKNNKKQKYDKYLSQKYVSRGVMLYAQDLIKKESATLPQITRFYAYISTTFFDIYNTNGDISTTLYAVKNVINTIYPKYRDTTDGVITVLSKKPLPIEIYGKENDKLGEITQWINNDGSGVQMSGDTKDKLGWENIPIQSLESSMAGSWKHWVLDDSVTNLNFGDKPAELTNLYSEEIKDIKAVTKNLTAAQKNTSLFWLNNKDKEGIAGIWQNYLYDETDKSKVSELQFAKMQKNLAISLADTTIEVWKVKYANWSPRLQHTNPEVVSLVELPLNPRFVSEYAAIGVVASEILSFYLPNQKEIFMQSSRDSRDSGKWAGILLDSDNQSGYKLGKNIAIEIIKKLT
jgi:hypothetical protein